MTHEELVKAAVALGVQHAKGIAILARPGSSDPIKIGVHGTSVPHSAAAALLHREKEDLNGYNLYLSYEPTQICLGLAWRAKVDTVAFMTLMRLTEISPTKPDDSRFGYGTKTSSTTGVDILKTDVRARSKFLEAIKSKIPKEFVEGRPLHDGLVKTLATGLAARMPVPGGNMLEVHEVFMRLVYALVRWGWNDDVPKDQRAGPDKPRPFGNNIGGIIVSADNRILAWGLNMKSANPTFHAETMMALAWLERTGKTSLPDGCRVYTSLECCNMCAGHIATLGRNVSVFYGQKDTNIAPTALSRGVNGCMQHPAANSHRTWLDVSQAALYGATATIDFLFEKDKDPSSKKAPMKGHHIDSYANRMNLTGSKDAFEHGAHLLPLRFPPTAIALAENRDPGFVRKLAGDVQFPAPHVAKEAGTFLEELARVGVLGSQPV